jgi:hypothetical protein
VHVHPFHVIVIPVGLLFVLRRMDVAQRGPDQYPGVDSEAFARWKLSASRAYRLGLSACFAKVLLDYCFAYLLGAYPPPAAVRWSIGLTLDIGWVILVGVSYWRVRRAHALARELGIEKSPGKD